MIKDYRILAVSLVVLVVIIGLSVFKTTQPEYAQYQKAYYEAMDVDDYKIEVNQLNVQTPSGMLVDRCQTCHMGATNKDAANLDQPLTVHPPIVPGRTEDPHDLNAMGCVVCHDGNGRGLTTHDAHGDKDKHWVSPLLSGKHAQANCTSCHAGDKDLAGADMLNMGRHLFIEKECWSCHTIAGVSSGTKGPDLTDAGAKFKMDYLRESIVHPRANLSSSTMPKFDWVDVDEKAVEALAIYLKSQRKSKLRDASKAPVEFQAPKVVWKPLAQEASVAYGKQIFHGKSDDGAPLRGGCISCHSYSVEQPVMKDGKVLTKYIGGSIGPELTYAHRSRGDEYIREHLKDPASHAVDTIMPKFDMLSEIEVKSILKFLESLKLEPQPRSAEVLYASKCASCHGETFDGKGRIVKDNPLLDPLPRKFDGKFVAAYKDRFPVSIKNGVKGTSMPSWNGVLTDDEIAKLIGYIEKNTKPDGEYVRLQAKLPKVGEDDSLTKKTLVTPDPKLGRVAFQKLCTGCHGKLANGKGPNAYNLVHPLPRNLINKEYMTKNGITDERLYQSILLGVPGTAMQVERLSDQKILNLIAYLRSINTDKPKPGQAGTGKAGDKREQLVLPRVGDNDRLTAEAIKEPDATRGRKTFLQSCITCHARAGSARGGKEPEMLWNTLKIKGATDEHLYRVTLKGKANTHMPPYERILSDQEVLDVISYLRKRDKENK